MIEVNNVSKSFKNVTVIDQVNVTFADERITGIVGRNGSGKTILFKMICGLMKPSEGTIIVNGEQIGKDVDFPSSIGAIIENPGFLPWQNGMEALMDLARINKIADKSRVRETMERVGLDPDSKKRIGKYSLGMKQRLGIAQAIMENPKVIILDEPMNGLDNQGVEDIRKILLDLKADGCTILIASHNKEDIEILCDTVYEMDHGRLSGIYCKDEPTGVNG